jgi:tRNA pseudouridine32 synthase/23S rRNA pseudouridine746 synthase
MQSLAIVKTHPDWIIVNKPAGISMQQEQGQPSELSLLQLTLATAQQHDVHLKRLWPVHRLDKATSGLVIFAKSAEAAAQFGELFATQNITKHYIALAQGKPKKKQGWVKGDMEKGRNGSWLLTRSLSAPAITYFNSCGVESHFGSAIRFYLVTPKTGKTHQIRVALKSLGCPILGDKRYKGSKADRCYLHAFCLEFNWLGEMISAKCEPAQGCWPSLKEVGLINELFV